MTSGIFKHSYKTKTRESLPIAIYNSGVQQCEPGYLWGPGVRDHYLIHHVISGKGSYHADGQQYQLEAGDTFIIYPGMVVSYSADLSQPWEYCWVGFQGAEAKVLMKQTPFSKKAPVVHFDPPTAIETAIMSIYKASGSTPCSQVKTIGLLYLFLSLLMEQAPCPVSDLSLEYVESAISFISHNYSGPIDVGDISSNVGISRSHLYRVFMKHMGTSPNDYLTRFRIARACELLRQSSLPVGAIAASAVYDDQLYFSRVFKKIMGVSPTRYAAQGRTQETATPSRKD